MSDLIKIAGWSGSTRANVVFVHGLDGHPYDTWRRGRSSPASDPSFWPLWLAEDIKGLDVFTLGYAASASGWKADDMPMEDRVSNVVERLLDADDILSAPITFVCHSLGGLIVKQALLQLNEQKTIDARSKSLLDRVKQVVFLGTPHGGATGATLMDRLRLLIWPSALSAALVADAPALRRINNSYRVLARERQGTLKHQVFFETQPTVLGKIVKEGSADPGLECRAIPLDANHFTIARPRDRTSLAYEKIVSFISEQPLLQEPGTLIRESLPAYAPERSFNPVGKTLRVASLALIAGIFYLAVSALMVRPPPTSVDELTFAAVLAAISNDDDRLRVARVMYGHDLTTEQIVRVREIRSAFASPPQLPAEKEREIREARTPEDLAKVISTLNLKPCGGSFDFQVQGASLACANGATIPSLASTNASAPLESRDALVFHSSETGNTEAELRILSGNTDFKNVSAHIVIARSGAIVQIVPLDRQAFHAGRSEWKERGITNLNRHSIGIMLSNRGQLKRNDDGTFGDGRIPADRVTTIDKGGQATYWESFTPEQIKSVQGIVKAFRSIQPDIGILRHQDISPYKSDPGPAFPIEKLQATDGR